MPRKGSHEAYAPLPSTLERSEPDAQNTYEKTLEHAEKEYVDDEERAHRVAWGAVKHSYEKVGDHWERKAERGPSDPRSASGGAHPTGRSFGGVDVNGHSRDELMRQAQALGLEIPSRAVKSDIAEAINTENRRRTRAAREGTKTK